MSLVSFSRRRSRWLAAGWATVIAFAISPTPSSSAESFYAPAIRWHHTDAMPLRVWIESGDDSATPFDEHVRAAFAVWSSVAPIEFDLSPDSATADIRVYSSELVLLDADGESVHALTHCEIDDNARIIGADILVAIRRANGRLLSPDALRALMMHEAGHALGLEHSADSSSIMFATVRVDGLSARDVASVGALYGVSTVRPTLLSRQ